MNIEHSKNINTGTLNTHGGNIHLGDNYYKSAEYKDLKEREEELTDLLRASQDEVKKLKYSERLNEVKKQIEELKIDIISLAETFQNIKLDTKRLKVALSHFQKGDYKEARAVLDAENMTIELDSLLSQKDSLQEKTKENTKNLKSKADEFLILAKLTAINYELAHWFEKAKEYYEKSLQADRNIENLNSYSKFLHKNGELSKAKYLYLKLIEMYRELSPDELTPYLPNLGVLYSNLGVLQDDNKELESAKKNYEKSLSLFKKLAEDDKENEFYYLSMTGRTLINLGSLNKDINDFGSAKIFYLESLQIYKKLTQADAQSYILERATILTNLGSIHLEESEFGLAKNLFCKALSICLHSKKPDASILKNIGLYLQNTGNAHAEKKEYELAEKYYKESLKYLQEAHKIIKQLVKKDVNRYLFELSGVLIIIGDLQYARNDFKKAEVLFNEAITIIKKSGNKQAANYYPILGHSLMKLGGMQLNQNKFDEAQKTFLETLEIYENLVTNDSQIYMGDLGRNLNNLAIAYNLNNLSEKAEKTFQSALEIFLEFAKNQPDRFLNESINNLEDSKTQTAEISIIKDRLAVKDPNCYLPDLGITYFNIAFIKTQNNEIEDAEAFYNSALEVFDKLFENSPEIYSSEFNKVLVNMSIFYQNSKIDKELSLKYADGSMRLLFPHLHDPNVQNYLERVYAVLQNWNIDVEEYLKKGNFNDSQ